MKKDTLITAAGRNPEANFGVVNPPVYHVSTILSPTMGEYKNRTNKRYTYGRNATPTNESLEFAISNIYGAKGSVLAPSGMGAITNSLMSILKSNESRATAIATFSEVFMFCMLISLNC